jgi:hypothetical protein
MNETNTRIDLKGLTPFDMANLIYS